MPAVTAGVCATAVLVGEVQPFVWLVTIKLYVPTALTVGVRVLAPLTIFPVGVVHRYVKLAPCEDPVPFSWMDAVLQFRFPGVMALATGAVIFWVTVATADAVHPLELSATTKVYEPGTVTTGFCAVDTKPPGPVQPNTDVPELELALSCALVTVHVNWPPVAEITGAVVFDMTAAVAVAVQPLVGFWTVTV